MFDLSYQLFIIYCCYICRDYIINDLNLNVGSISELNSKSQSTKSFKVNASIDVRDKLLNSDLWPVGLVCRKFFNFSKKINNA